MLEAIATSAPELPAGATFSYGTAGFRTKGHLLPSVGFRVGLVAALRSRGCDCRATGVMVTASHNPAADNGVKLVDADANMLALAWEPHATTLANCRNGAEVAAALRLIAEGEGIDLSGATRCMPIVHVARDTRDTGPAIVENVVRGARALGARVVDHGVVTTPMLHEMVALGREMSPAADPCVADYDKKLLESAAACFTHAATLAAACAMPKTYVIVDCGNGVGAIHLQRLLRDGSPLALHAPILRDAMEVICVNTDTATPHLLNHECGADHAQKTRKPHPLLLQTFRELVAHRGVDPAAVHLYSFDGDADRIVAFHTADGEAASLLDGDRIIALLSSLVATLLKAWRCGSGGDADAFEFLDSLDIGAVQTAYANGASTAFIQRELHLPVQCTATGVKFLHPAAHQRDVGIYFEANGHGSVLFSARFQAAVRRAAAVLSASNTSATLNASVRMLEALAGLLSQCCGDAIADLLACEVALRVASWTPADWLACYADLPSVQLKVDVRDPSVITNNDDQTLALTPPGLQARIQELVTSSSDGGARSFVRPSGTEPIVRVYAEATTEAAARALGEAVSSVVKEFCR